MIDERALKVAMFCAREPERNTGMVTVDTAGHAILRRAFPNATISRFCWGEAGRYGYREGEVPYPHTDIRGREAAYLGADLRVVWGDFTQAAVLWKPNDDAWPDRPAPSREEVARVVFLADQPPETMARTIVFGNSIITNRAEDFLEPVYARAFDRFMRGAGGVLFRDGLSAAKVAGLRGGEATLGMDCAFMRDDDDLAGIDGYRPPAERSGIGVFFGRSPNRLALLAFSRGVGRAMGRPCHWVPWLWSGRSTRLPARLFGYDVEPDELAAGAPIAALACCEFVITDTYHCCINAWQMGIPAICIGLGAGSANGTLSDKKKEILYEMYDARSFYFFTEWLTGLRGRNDAVARAAAALRNREVIDIVSATIAQHRGAALARLHAALAAAAMRIA